MLAKEFPLSGIWKPLALRPIYLARLSNQLKAINKISKI